MSLSKPFIVAVDSSESNLKQIKAVLNPYYEIMVFVDGQKATEYLQKHPPALILAGENIFSKGLLQFIRTLRMKENTCDIPIITMINMKKNASLEKEANSAGANGHISIPAHKKLLLIAVSDHLKAGVTKKWEALPEAPKTALKSSARIFEDLNSMIVTGEQVEFKQIKDNCQSLVQAIENAEFVSILDGVKDYDDYTYAHSMRVATLLSLLGHAAGFSNEEQLLLSSGGLLHDVGKMMIPHEILNKPGRLNDEEFELMKTHVPETIKYLEKSEDIPKGIFVIAEQHHEKIDGTGYPHGLQGSELNELARMSAVVDVFSALTDRRVYKPPMPGEKAMQIMSEEMTTHLDQNYVKMFRSILVDTGVLT